MKLDSNPETGAETKDSSACFKRRTRHLGNHFSLLGVRLQTTNRLYRQDDPRHKKIEGLFFLTERIHSFLFF